MAEVKARFNKKTGNVEFEVNGIKGVACKEITDVLAQEVDVYDEEEKAELYETVDNPDFVENM